MNFRIYLILSSWTFYLSLKRSYALNLLNFFIDKQLYKKYFILYIIFSINQLFEIAMEKKEIFASRWGIIFAGLGMAVGTGNIWRFPRIISQYGGDAFIIAWILFLLLWSILLLIIEISIGKKTRLGVIGSFGKIIGGRFAWMGTFVAFVTTAITFYYTVVTGWILNISLQQHFRGLSGKILLNSGILLRHRGSKLLC